MQDFATRYRYCMPTKCVCMLQFRWSAVVSARCAHAYRRYGTWYPCSLRTASRFYPVHADFLQAGKLSGGEIEIGNV
jgi:hypothetical protein